MPSSNATWGVYFRTAGFRPLILVTLAVFATFALAGCSSESEPAATAVPTATATSVPPATATPEAVDETTVNELLNSIERSTEQIREIDTPPSVEHMFVDKQGMQDRIEEELTDPEVVDELLQESALLKLLGIIPYESFLGALYDNMLTSQVLGLYDSEKDQFFVLADDQLDGDSLASGLDIEAQLTYAHEYVHRLQDAKFDLEVLKKLADNNDMSLAVAALIEGDATIVQTQYMLENFDVLELSALLEKALASQAELGSANVPPFLQRGLEFPYADGAAFVSILMQMGGFAAVDAVFKNLPKSTEQILHPEKYFDAEQPVKIDIADDTMGSGWSVNSENVLGEFFLGSWLETLGANDASIAAAGWGGDGYAVFEDGGGDFALALMIAWDSNSEASEFFEIASGGLDGARGFTALNQRDVPGELKS